MGILPTKSMKDSSVKMFMDIAERVASESYAIRLKVGCIIVKDQERIISIGYNGTPAGWNNICEINTGVDSVGNEKLVTKPEVIHAEANAVAKVAKSTESSKDADVFVTHAPCLECAKTLAVSGVKTVYYKYDYRDTVGLDHLKKCKIEVIKVEETEND